MKFLLALLLILLFSAQAQPWDRSVNYISNPDFSIPQLGSSRFNAFTSAGAWSEITNRIQIVNAKMWNKRWSSGQLCDLTSDRLSTIYQIINLNVGYYELSITWAANQFTQFNDSKWSLYWNDVLIKSFIGTDYEIHKETLTVKAIKGANNLTLKSQSNSRDYGAGIKLVELFAQAKPILSYDSSVNYISNPDFSIPKLTTINVYTQTAGAWSEVYNKIEIGLGSLFNSRWDPSSQVCELGADFNSNVYQSINLDAGYYQLNIIWAAKQNQTFVTSQWSVYWNDALVIFFNPVDYEIHKETLIVKAKQGANKLSLRGEGTNDIYGAGIKLVELFAQVKPVLSYDSSVNYVSNPDCSFPKVVTGDFIIGQSAGAWSEVNKLIEVGRGTFYNSRFTSGQVCELAAHYNSNIYQTINLDEEYYQLSITWAAKQNATLLTSQFSVYWNDVFVKKFTPIDYNIHKQTLILKANQGANKLSLRGEGINDWMGAVIKLIQLFGQNNIKNGNFQTPDTRGGWQISQSAGQWSSYTNEIEIGIGNMYNSVWKTGQVAELDANKNSQIYQVVSIPAGKYHLRFNWAARSGIPLASNAFSVWWNKTKLAQTTAIDYQLHTFTTDIVANSSGNHILLLKGEGISDSYGVTVDNVRLWTVV